MSDEEILEAIATIAREQLEWEGSLSAEMRLVEDLELDSIRLMTLAMWIENHFRIRLSEDDEAAIETVGDLIAVVKREADASA